MLKPPSDVARGEVFTNLATRFYTSGLTTCAASPDQCQ